MKMSVRLGRPDVDTAVETRLARFTVCLVHKDLLKGKMALVLVSKMPENSLKLKE